jgi:glycine cleavage system regulatory protein
LPNQVDVDFISNTGGRTVQDNKDKTLSQEPESLSQKIKKVQEDAILAEATTEAYRQHGMKPPEEKPKGGEEAPSVVSVALNQMNNMIKETNEMAKAKSVEVTAARKEADDARTNLFTTQLAMINELHKNLMETQKKMGEMNSPESAMAMVEKWEGILNRFKPQLQPESTPVHAKVTTDETALKLEQMRQNHEIEMEKLRSDRQKADHEFELRMAQFQEEIRRHYREYEDSMKFRENAYNGFSDLAASIAAGIDKERGVATRVAENAAEPVLGGFNCELCGTHIDLMEGQEDYICPKDGCHATYKVKVK